MLKTEKGSVQILLIVFIAISLATGFFAYVLYMAKEYRSRRLPLLKKRNLNLKPPKKTFKAACWIKMNNLKNYVLN